MTGVRAPMRTAESVLRGAALARIATHLSPALSITRCATYADSLPAVEYGLVSVRQGSSLQNPWLD